MWSDLIKHNNLYNGLPSDEIHKTHEHEIIEVKNLEAAWGPMVLNIQHL